MPNWTANSVIITANNNAQQNKIKELHDRMFNGDETFLDGLFEYFVPSSCVIRAIKLFFDDINVYHVICFSFKHTITVNKTVYCI